MTSTRLPRPSDRPKLGARCRSTTYRPRRPPALQAFALEAYTFAATTRDVAQSTLEDCTIIAHELGVDVGDLPEERDALSPTKLASEVRRRCGAIKDALRAVAPFETLVEVADCSDEEHAACEDVFDLPASCVVRARVLSGSKRVSYSVLQALVGPLYWTQRELRALKIPVIPGPLDAPATRAAVCDEAIRRTGAQHVAEWKDAFEASTEASGLLVLAALPQIRCEWSR